LSLSICQEKKMNEQQNRQGRQERRERSPEQIARAQERRKMAEAFQQALYDHDKWSFETDTFFEYIQRTRTENHLFHVAVELGPEFVKDFERRQAGAISRIIRTVRTKIAAEHQERLNALIPTGDAEFDAFRDKVFGHDFWYEYSDDGGVWRRGQEARNEIEKIAKEKGGIYQTFWSFFQKETVRRSNESIERQKKERIAAEAAQQS
jgi:hypothetical protein